MRNMLDFTPNLYVK